MIDLHAALCRVKSSEKLSEELSELLLSIGGQACPER
jgi:hypothetical protein